MHRLKEPALHTLGKTTFRECFGQCNNFIISEVDDNISERFRKRLRELRIQRGWTQEKAAEICGIGHKLFQLYELGIKPNPGLLTLDKIARGFGIEVHELLNPSNPSSTLLTVKETSRKKATRANRKA